ncbi:MAG: hypothetical protein JW395_3425 [Nitrospira sp.]|nr:hypothetical protein [Nitrospira sp.]
MEEWLGKNSIAFSFEHVELVLRLQCGKYPGGGGVKVDMPGAEMVTASWCNGTFLSQYPCLVFEYLEGPWNQLFGLVGAIPRGGFAACDENRQLVVTGNTNLARNGPGVDSASLRNTLSDGPVSLNAIDMQLARRVESNQQILRGAVHGQMSRTVGQLQRRAQGSHPASLRVHLEHA